MESDFDIINSIEGTDIFNSLLLFNIDKLKESEFLEYTNNRFNDRLDLISTDIFNTIKYQGIISIVNRLDPKNIPIKAKLSYVPVSTIKSLL